HELNADDLVVRREDVLLKEVQLLAVAVFGRGVGAVAHIANSLLPLAFCRKPRDGRPWALIPISSPLPFDVAGLRPSSASRRSRPGFRARTACRASTNGASRNTRRRPTPRRTKGRRPSLSWHRAGGHPSTCRRPFRNWHRSARTRPGSSCPAAR